MDQLNPDRSRDPIPVTAAANKLWTNTESLGFKLASKNNGTTQLHTHGCNTIDSLKRDHWKLHVSNSVHVRGKFHYTWEVHVPSISWKHPPPPPTHFWRRKLFVTDSSSVLSKICPTHIWKQTSWFLLKWMSPRLSVSQGVGVLCGEGACESGLWSQGSGWKPGCTDWGAQWQLQSHQILPWFLVLSPPLHHRAPHQRWSLCGVKASLDSPPSPPNPHTHSLLTGFQDVNWQNREGGLAFTGQGWQTQGLAYKRGSLVLPSCSTWDRVVVFLPTWRGEAAITLHVIVSMDGLAGPSPINSISLSLTIL